MAVNKYDKNTQFDSKTKLYRKWADMLQRCKNPKSTNYKYYGEKGVSVCNSWHDFQNFKRWAESNGYEEHLSIERLDPTGNYEPGNCTWASRREQDFNKRNTKYVTIEGVKKPLKLVAEEYGFSYSSLRHRYLLGIRDEKIIEPLHQGISDKPMKRAIKKLTLEQVAEIKWLLGNTDLLQKEIGEKFGVTQMMISRIKLGRAFREIQPAIVKGDIQ